MTREPTDVTDTADDESSIHADVVRGRSCGRYLLLDAIGAGGNGIVYRAYDPDLDRQLAIKLLRGPGSAKAAARVYREAQAIARLSHRNVLAIYDVGTHDGEVYIAMELATGGSLKEWLAQAKAKPHEILDVFLEAGEGLVAAHAAGLVHRDFKPANVLLGADGSAKVADFGLARAFGERGSDADDEDTTRQSPASGSSPASPSPYNTLTAPGAVVGTPVYMAPEQLAGERVDHRADQFAFCVSLHEGLTGKRPKRRPDGQVEVDPTIPAAWRRALRIGLAREPEQRYPSLRGLLRDLSRRPRRRGMLAVAILAIAGAAVVASQFLGGASDAGQSCSEMASEFEEIWNPRVASTLEQSFDQSSYSEAEVTFRALKERLDQRASQWKEERTGTCASYQRGLLSDTLFDRRIACHDRWLDTMGIYLEAWRTGGPEVLEDSLAVLAEAPSLAQCDSKALLGEEAGPSDARSEANMAAINRANALSDVGRLEEASQLVEPVLSAADARQDHWVLGEALFSRALVEKRRNENSKALETLDRSATHAALAHNDELLAVVASEMTTLISDRFHRTDEGVRLGRWAVVLAKRRDNDEALLGRARKALGIALQQRGQYDDAERQLRMSLEIAEKQGDRPYLVVWRLASLGLTQMLARKLEAARATLSDALARLDELEPDRYSESRASIRNNLASTLWAMGVRDEAIELMEDNIRELRRARGPTSETLYHAMQNLVFTLAQADRAREAVVLGKELLNTLEQLDEPAQPKWGYYYQALGLAQLEAGDYDDATESLQTAADLMRKAGKEPLPGINDVYTMRADAFLRGGKPRLAKGDIESALDEHERQGNGAGERAWSVFIQAQIEWELGNRAAALRLAEQSLRDLPESPIDTTDDQAKVRAWLDSRR